MRVVGDFIYDYRENSTVAVANTKSTQLVGQIKVSERMTHVTQHTGYYCNMVYNGFTYIGIVFIAIPENQLISVLS